MTILAIIKKDYSSSGLIATFLNEFKAHVSISKVRFAVPVNGIIEICFCRSGYSLVSFHVTEISVTWNIKSELKEENLITIRSQVGEGQSQVFD